MRSRGAKYSKLPASALGTGYNGSDVDELAAGENLVRGKDGIWITPEMREMMEDKNLNVSNLKKKALAGRLEKEAAEAEEAAADPDFAKIWNSMQIFRARYAVWQELGYL